MHTQRSHQFTLLIALRMTRISNGRGPGLGHCCAVPVQQVESFRSGFQVIYSGSMQAAGLGKINITNTKIISLLNL